MTGEDRCRVTIQTVHASGNLGNMQNIYPNVCDECMAEVRKAIGDLDMSKPPEESK